MWVEGVQRGGCLPAQFGKPTNERMHSFVGPLAACGSSAMASWLSGEVGWVVGSGRSGGSDGDGSGR